MAKSIRASSHIKAKSVKRKAEFQKVVDARALRVSAKLQEDLIGQKLRELREKEGADVNEEEFVKAEKAKLEADKSDATASKKKVSTSGWRDARHHNYKKSRVGKNKKKGHFTRF